jgi:hypothetical protein
MPKIIFIYRENKYEMVIEDRNLNIFYEYSKILNVKINDLLFLYKGKNISLFNSQIIISILKNN